MSNKFNPEAFGIERIRNRSRAAGDDTYIKREKLKDGKTRVQLRLNEKLTTDFHRYFGERVGIGFKDGNLFFYPEQDTRYSVAISSNGDSSKTAIIRVPVESYTRLEEMYGPNYKKVKCNFTRHMLEGNACYEIIGTDIEFSHEVS